jgi:uncharacterized protein YjbJ (UPF0337 family)
LNDTAADGDAGEAAGPWERLKANWAQTRARLQVQWGRLTDDQLEVIEGRRELLLGQMQQSYGIDREEAERQLAAWECEEERRAAARRGAV